MTPRLLNIDTLRCLLDRTAGDALVNLTIRGAETSMRYAVGDAITDHDEVVPAVSRRRRRTAAATQRL